MFSGKPLLADSVVTWLRFQTSSVFHSMAKKASTSTEKKAKPADKKGKSTKNEGSDEQQSKVCPFGY